MDFKSNGQDQNKASSAIGSRTNSKGVERKGRNHFRKAPSNINRKRYDHRRNFTLSFLEPKCILFDDIIQESRELFFI